MAVTKIEGKLVGLFISTNIAVPAYKEVICSTGHSMEGTRDTSSVATKCGIYKSKGLPNYTIPVSGLGDATPDAGKMSADQLLELFDSGDDFLWKTVHATDDALIYRQGQGYFSGYSEEYPAEGYMTFDGTIEVEGNIVIVAPE